MHTSAQPALRRLVVLVDVLLILLSLGFSHFLHDSLRSCVPFLKDPPSVQTYLRLAVFCVPLWAFLIPLQRLDRVLEERWTRGKLFFGLLRLQGSGLLALLVLLFTTQIVVNRTIIGFFLLCSFLLLYLERLVIQLRLQHHYRTELGRLRLLLVGEPTSEMASFVRQAERDTFPPRFVGRVSTASPLEETDRVPPSSGSLDELGDLMHSEAVDALVFFPPFPDAPALKDALGVCEPLGIPAYFWLQPIGEIDVPRRWAELFNEPFLRFGFSEKPPAALAIKHALDVVLSVLLVILLLPLLLLVGLAILVTMGRPVLFVQERSGLNGRVFHMLKFRTMVRDAERQKAEILADNEMNGPVFKSSHDFRVTRLGRFLRRWSIDELPQLFNVLHGTMSLVGPRPLPVAEQAQIRGSQRRRLSMKPGITGLWQVSGRSDVDFEDWMLLDLQYVDRWSLAFDFELLARTSLAVLSGRGAK